jgi:urea transport system substrate-binding protein
VEDGCRKRPRSFDPDKVIAASVRHRVLNAPEGLVRVHATNHHVWKKVRVGRARADGQFDIVGNRGDRAEPVPQAV